VKRLIVAIQFLTRLPTPRVASSDQDFAASMRWFPAVGLIVGALVAAGGWAGAWLGPSAGALGALVPWVGVTGAPRPGGLGDGADACSAAHKDRTRMLAVLADPRIGSFAVVAIALQLIAKLVLLHALIAAQAFAAIALVPFAARIGPLLWSWWLPELHEGLASRFLNIVRPIDLALWGALLVAAAWISPSLLMTPLVLVIFGVWLRRALGGIAG